jgi:hypothetical protein
MQQAPIVHLHAAASGKQHAGACSFAHGGHGEGSGVGMGRAVEGMGEIPFAAQERGRP